MNKLKKNRGKIALFALVMIWALSPTVSQAQYWMRTYGHLDNYYLIRDSTEAFFSADTSRIRNSVYGFKHFQRWKTFLESRVNENGTLATYHQNLAQEYENILLTDDDRTPGQWNSLGPVTGTTGVLAELGIVTSLLVIDDQNIYAGTGTAGLFVTNNGGATWRSLTDKYLITGIESIIKIDPDTIYIATGFDTWGKVYGKGILKSEDNGLTWKETGLNSNFIDGSPFTVKGMIADPDSSGTFYAIVQEEHRRNARIVKSGDAGVTWDEKYIQSDIDLRKIEMDPTNSNRIMASGRRVVLSNDKGESWHDITTRIPYDTAQYRIIRATTSFHPTIPRKILVALKKENKTGSIYGPVEIYLSNDGGGEFTKCSFSADTLFSGLYSEDKLELEWSKVHTDICYIGGIWINELRLYNHEVYLYIDNFNYGYHVDIRYLETRAIEGKDSNGDSRYLDVLYHGNDGGITKGVECTESGMIWQDISGTGLNITQYYGLGITDSVPELYLGGTQDGNLFIHDNAGWHNRGDTGDAGDAVIDYDNPANIYMIHFCGSSYLTISKDYGQSWDYLEVGMPNEGWYRRNDGPLEMSKRDPSILFVGGKQVYKSRKVNGQLVFNKISNFSEIYPYFKTIRVAKNSDNFIIAGRQNAIWGDTINTVRLHLTLNGGAYWYNITPIDILDDAGIFDIAIDPKKHNKFYIALDRFNANKKVYKGEWGLNDTTVTWTNMSEGLPNVPVNCIKIYEGSDFEEMFAGTDCGVYYYNNIIEKWVKFGRGMPVCPVSDLEINYYTGQLIASTFGRGMYRAELCEIGPAESTIYIDTIKVWEDSLRIPADIIILPGGNLTIKGKIQMKYNKSITVRPGAFLTVDGGTVSSYCSTEPWSGIRVFGTASGGQNPLYQGVLLLKNGATIANANIGVHCINPTDHRDLYNPITGGGIVMANNTTFKNNITAVQFERYTYTWSISNFRNCIFETESSALPGYPKKYFVRLNEIGGLFFGACIFKNTINLFSSDSLTKHGIYSVNSHFVVDRQCPTTPCPEGDEYKSKFENLVYGIHATSNTGTKSFKVNNSIFNSNDCGIYSLNTSNIDVRFNHFKVSKVGVKKTGLYLDYSTNFVIEENEFEYSLSDSPEMGTRGMVINNSGDLDNHIYKNTFKNLEYGICSQDINRNKDGSRGLRIKCNDFKQTKFDIAITRSQIISGYGIAYAQGSAEDSTKPAGNLFSNLPTSTGYYGILNNCERIEYTHHDPTGNSRVRPSNYSLLNVYLNNSGLRYSPACCPSNVSGGGGTIDQQLLAEEEMSDSIQSELSQLIDDGNTEVKLFTINTSLPDENIEIHNDLLNTSPFVSDTVIQTVIIREEIFNNAMVRNLIVANPHTAKSEVVLQGISNRLEPMPEYLMDEILEAMDTLSIKELMEIKMQIGHSNYTYGLNRLLSHVLSDTTFSIDSIFNILNLDNSFHSQMKKAWFELEDGDTTKALSTLDSMNVSNQLTNSQSLELAEQSAFMEWLVNNQIIDSTKSVALNYFLSSPSAYVSSCARVLMIFNNLMQYSEPYLVPDLTKTTDVKKEKQYKQIISERYIKVYPNPTRDYVTVEYKLKEAGVNGSIRIIDENGKLIKSLPLSKQRDQLIVDTRNLKAGNYFIKLISGNKEHSTARFTIIY